MKSNDILKKKGELQQRLQNAVASGNEQEFGCALDDMMQFIADNVRAEYEQKVSDLQQEMDSRILSTRGVHQLTSEERSYYTKLLEAMNAADPRQAVNGMPDALPRTVINSVFDDLKQNHPLLSKINFHPSAGAVEMIINTTGENVAVWGPLTAKIVEEATAGMKKISTTLMKLSAFLCVCKSMLELGPEWFDRFVRETLYEALAAGMEYGIVSGDGKDQPIGMIRQIGDDVSVVGGKYPEKAAIKVSEFSAATMGTLIGMISISPSGAPRVADDLILLCNPQDYYEKVMPATTLRAPDGTYRNDVMPYPMLSIPTSALKQRGKAVFGSAKRYLALAGTSKNGKIEYSDDYRFLEDERVYIGKAFANGTPVDNNSFLVLDISDLRPAIYPTETVAAPTPSNVATLSGLRVGKMKFSPAFVSDTKTYTTETTDATGTISAVPSDVGAKIDITVSEAVVNNGQSVTWQEGANTVTVKVTAADGTTTDSYTVTVTKS